MRMGSMISGETSGLVLTQVQGQIASDGEQGQRAQWQQGAQRRESRSRRCEEDHPQG
jgi:hypothetical protein